jgi:hypothetical protein
MVSMAAAALLYLSGCCCLDLVNDWIATNFNPTCDLPCGVTLHAPHQGPLDPSVEMAPGLSRPRAQAF